MSSVVAVTTSQPTTTSRRRLIASGHIYPRRTAPTPARGGKTCIWCGHAIDVTDPMERIGLAELHQFPCVEQFEIHAYGEEGNR